MSVQVGSINNATFAKDAIKYLQGQKIEEESTGKQIVSSLPTSIGFASAFQIIPALSKARKFKDLKNVVGADEFRKIWSSTVENPDVLDKVRQFAQDDPKKFTGIFSKIKNLFTKKSAEELSKAAGENAVKKVAKTASKTFMGEAKGFFLFNMLFQLTDIIPAFQGGGAGEGVKQTAKSAVHAAGDALAFTAGMKLGAAAGAKIGATIGTAGAGPIGTLIGGALGIVIGGVASTLAGKLITKLVGKSYTEKQAEEQGEATSQAIAQDSASIEELKALVAQKILEDQADGKISDDSKIMLKELNELQTNATSFGSLTGVKNPSADVNLGVRTNILNQQAQGIYNLKNLPKNADGSINHSIYDINLAA